VHTATSRDGRGTSSKDEASVLEREPELAEVDALVADVRSGHGGR
jgi:hypothetical protein